MTRLKKLKTTTVNTALRGIPIRVKEDYRLLAAQVIKDTGKACTMNALMVKAVIEYVNTPENQFLVHK